MYKIVKRKIGHVIIETSTKLVVEVIQTKTAAEDLCRFLNNGGAFADHFPQFMGRHA